MALEKTERNGQLKLYLILLCGSKYRISHHSYLKNYNLYYPDFFSFLDIIIFCVAIMSKKQINKKGEGGEGGSLFSCNCKKTTKGQFHFQMSILHQGTRVSFKTNNVLAGKSYHNGY